MRLSNLSGLLGGERQSQAALQGQGDATTNYDCTNRLREISAPTLVVHGRHDQVAPFAIAEEMAMTTPDAELVAFNGGHLISLVTHTDKFIAAVRNFLAEKS